MNRAALRLCPSGEYPGYYHLGRGRGKVNAASRRAVSELQSAEGTIAFPQTPATNCLVSSTNALK